MKTASAMTQEKTVHLSGYQARDREIVDYQMFELGTTGLSFRGPAPASLDPGQYFACLGAAQTFGCFCDTPYPSHLARALQMPVLNLGYGGAGPEFFNRQSSLLPYINGARFVVLQVMSARSQSNSVFASDGLELLERRSDGRTLGANEAYQGLLQGSKALRSLPPKRLWRALAKRLAIPALQTVVQETRQNWLANQLELLKKIEVPVVVLWFSKRSPDYTEKYRSVSTLFGDFPQMVNKQMIETVKSHCKIYVEVVSQRGSPQPLISRFTGQPTTINPEHDRPDLNTGNLWTHNHYYPSPEMQVDAADALIPVCQKLVAGEITRL